MNISQAKEELIHTVKVYLEQDEDGSYQMSRVRQRPVLLMGPPGIGKTAIMEQVARECGIGLVAYTMTHHTRQSAIGLPVVKTKMFAGKEYTVTEYTMSEIVASVYKLIEESGCKQGILFLDEINCVSETLAPVMLQFLQNKIFGNHELPEGWIIVAAGNPREYNKSAREFDIATLDRVRRMDITPDLEAWKKYALEAGIYGPIVSYLNCRPGSFYHIHQTIDGAEFVTARGWEDLSAILRAYARMKLPVTEKLIREYLACEEIAEDFYNYFRMYEELEKECPIVAILDGAIEEEKLESFRKYMQMCGKDKSLCVSGWFLSDVYFSLNQAKKEHQLWKRMDDMLKSFQFSSATVSESGAAEVLESFIQRNKAALKVKNKNSLLGEEDYQIDAQVLETFMDYAIGSCQKAGMSIREVTEGLAQCCLVQKEKWENKKEQASVRVLRALDFLKETFGIKEETISFLAGISTHSEMKEMEHGDTMKAYKESLLWLQADHIEKQVERLIEKQVNVR